MSNNKTFLKKSLYDISKNIQTCKKSIKKCCEITYEKMHYTLLTKRKLKEKKYVSLNKNYKDYYFNDDDDEENLYENSLMLDERKYYDGTINIWFSFNKTLFFKNAEPCHNTINILRPKKGYCLISRSCIKYNIPLRYCFNIYGCRLTNNSKLYLNKPIQIKYETWPMYYFGSIIKIKRGFNKEILLDLKMPSCPDSEIILGWHFNNSIEKNKKLLYYYLPNTTLNDDGKCKREISLETIEEVNEENDSNLELNVMETNTQLQENNIAAFLINEEEENTIIDQTPEITEKKEPLYASPLFFKDTIENNEILKYNVFWLNNQLYNTKMFRRKSVVVSSRENVQNIHTNYLPNVRILSEHHMKNIINIHKQERKSLKVVSRNSRNRTILNMVEPQVLDFFKYNKDYYKIAHALNNNLICTYTGVLSKAAKKYLFSI